MSTQRALAEQEFAHVVAQLTTEEVAALDRRTVNGDIDGWRFITGDCGCFYGSIGIERGITQANRFDVLALMRDLLKGLTSPWRNSGWTPLELEIAYVDPGDTPDTNEASAWLHGLLAAELARRQALDEDEAALQGNGEMI